MTRVSWPPGVVGLPDEQPVELFTYGAFDDGNGALVRGEGAILHLIRERGSRGAKVTIATAATIESFVATASAARHPLRKHLDRLTTASPGLFTVSKREGRV